MVVLPMKVEHKSSGKSTLILACVYPPENIIGGQRPARFSKYLPEFGYEPFVITASEQPNPAPAKVIHAPFRFGYRELLLSKTFFPCDDRLTWTSAAVAASTGVLVGNRQPVLFSTSPPVATHLAARRLKEMHGLPWVADFRDPLVDNFGRLSRLGRMADRQIEKLVARHADAVILNTEAAAANFQSRYPRYRDKVHFIYNGFDPNDGFRPQPLPPRPGKLWIHSGSVYINRYPFRLFDGLDRLAASHRLNSGFKVRMIGTVQDAALFELPSFRRLREAGHVDCTPEQIPRLAAMKETAEADGTIVFDHYHPDGVNLAIPAKTFDYVRLGRPILAFTSKGAHLHSVIVDSAVPNVCVFEDDPPETIDRKLSEFAALPSDPKPASASFRQKFSAIEQTRQLAEIFDSLTARQSPLRGSS